MNLYLISVTNMKLSFSNPSLHLPPGKLKEATRKIDLNTDRYADLFECLIHFYEYNDVCRLS